MKQENSDVLKRYQAVKQLHPDVIVLFSNGTFYECFEEDAIKVSNVLRLSLTEMKGSDVTPYYTAGFPSHALDTYLPRLILKGLRVAIL